MRKSSNKKRILSGLMALLVGTSVFSAPQTAESATFGVFLQDGSKSYSLEETGSWLGLQVTGTVARGEEPVLQTASPSPEEGMTLLEGWELENLTESAVLSMTVTLQELPELEPGEGLAVYKVSGGELGTAVLTDAAEGDSATFTVEAGSAEGVALVRLEAPEVPLVSTVKTVGKTLKGEPLTLTIEGLLPEDAEVRFISVKNNGRTTLFSYDLSVTDALGRSFIPAEPVQVAVSAERIGAAAAEGLSFSVEHMDSARNRERISPEVSGDTLTFSLSDFGRMTVRAALDLQEDWSWESDMVQLSGTMPQSADASVEEAAFETEEMEVLCAADITLYNYDTQIDPQWGDMEVTISAETVKEALEAGSELEVWQISPETEEVINVVTDLTLGEDSVSFSADSSSVYAVVTTLEKTLLAGDGRTYRITVTYDRSAGIPAGTDLSVSELDGEAYEEYLRRTEVVLETAGFEYARIFDISLVDSEGKEIQPETQVQVSVTLLDAEEGEEDFSVVHFGEEPEQMITETDGNVVSFSTEGFSAYAIVKGPSEIPLGWSGLATLEEVLGYASEGLILGNIKGYYFTDGITKINNTRTGITKTKPAQGTPPANAALYYLQQEGNKYKIYCLKNGERQYIVQSGNSLKFTGEGSASAFAITEGSTPGTFRATADNTYYINMQGGDNGASFAAYNSASDVNSQIAFWHSISIKEEPYGLEGKTYGLLSYDDGVTGKALMASAAGTGALEALPLTVLVKKEDREDRIFVPNDSEMTMWHFEWVEQDRYYLTANVNGSTRYLRLEGGVSLTAEPDDACKIQVTPGTGSHAGEISLRSGNAVLSYSGSAENGFRTGGKAGSEWLYLADLSELTSDYFMTYSARKVSVSDRSVTNGSRIIVYTRAWNDEEKKYEFYAIDHDGTLIRCFENGDSIQWVGNWINTMLWNLVEYYQEGTDIPNYFYELYNQYSEQFLAPQLTGGQLLSGEPIGINMNGRRNGKYYSSIVAWDETGYEYAGLKVEDGRIIPCPLAEADDFYFAVMQDLPVDDTLTTVNTVDHTQYGITMKMANFGSRAEMSGFLGSDAGGKVSTTVPNLLSTNLGSDGYPTAAGGSLGTLFAGAREVNHLFIQSTYSGSGYYEYDSTQNFASLDQGSGNFTVYKELGSMDTDSRDSLQHGQFMPFNDLTAGLFTSLNPKNQYTATLRPLPAGDPRKDERMYLVKNPDYYFGMEIEASFTQTENGLDAWGHDIIYEFTGDDDFWLYVDGELIIDLGGIHSALAGNVNFSTGQVNVNGKPTTLRALFEKNFRKRSPGASAAEVKAFLAEYFEEGSTIFRDYTTHTMRIFYMERGAGASNLHMRFNLASAKAGTVELSKVLSGIDTTESVLAQFPYQILYKTADGTEQLLEYTDALNAPVVYKDTATPVDYRSSLTVDGTTYENVFLLKPDEKAMITFPEDTAVYRIVECGVNTEVCAHVFMNGREMEGTAVEGHLDRKDFGTEYASTRERASVAYVNEINPDALLVLTITKRLYNESGETELRNDAAGFSFRLSLGTEFDSGLVLANMHSYHVKDPNGSYCRWDADQKRFVSLSKTDYSELTDAEKSAATFTTSMNGSIANIPAFYTVEVREVLAGTRFGVEEREEEIPDGYSLQKYILDGEESSEPVQGTAVTGRNPHVDVCNLRGWGLRVNKQWSDEEYMAERADTWFAVFTDDGTGNLTLVEGTLRSLKKNGKSIYWYFKTLPVSGVSFENYVIREVTVQNGAVDTVIEPDGQLELQGRQKGETVDSVFTYTVSYEKGEILSDSNVRVDTVTNSRPGIVLEKQDWTGNALAGAAFTLEDNDGNLIGSFSSGEDGRITVAFLRDDVDYVLKETAAPKGFCGPESPVILRQHEGSVEVSGVDEAWYTIRQEEGAPTAVILKNKPRSFRAVKIDGSTGEPLAGVKFALYRQVTVDGVVSIDLNPMPGYAGLITDAEGMIPKLDNTLAAGTYELRETAAVGAYEKLSSYIRFTVSPTGAVSLGNHPEEVTLSGEEISGEMVYTMTVPNYSNGKLTVTKTVTGDMGDRTMPFTFTLTSVAGENPGTAYAWEKTSGDEKTSGTLQSGETFTLAHGESIVLELPLQKEIVLTEDNGNYTTTWSGAAEASGSSCTLQLAGGAELSVTNQLNAVSPTGLRLHLHSWLWILGAGILLLAEIMIARRRKNR